MNTPEQPNPLTPQDGDNPHGYGAPGPGTPPGLWTAHGGNGPEEPKKKFPVWGVVLAAVLAVALLVGGVAALAGLSRSTTSAEESEQAPQAGTSENVAQPVGKFEASPQGSKRIVETYLQAVAEGRANDARALFVSLSGDGSLLTDEVLADSLKRAPITDIVVSEGTVTERENYSVPASYKIGGTPVSTTFEAWSDYKGGLQIYRGTQNLYLGRMEGLDVTVNGVKVADATRAQVFPGSYKLATTTKYFELDAPETLLVRGPEDKIAEQEILDIKPKANAEGIEMFRKKVVPEMQKCLEETTLKAGCELTVPATVDGAKLVDGTVERTMSAEEATKLRNVVPEPGSSVTTTLKANASDLGLVKTTVDAEKDGKQGRSEIFGFGMGPRSVSIDTTDPNLPVVWDAGS